LLLSHFIVVPVQLSFLVTRVLWPENSDMCLLMSVVTNCGCVGRRLPIQRHTEGILLY